MFVEKMIHSNDCTCVRVLNFKCYQNKKTKKDSKIFYYIAAKSWMRTIFTQTSKKES